MHRVLTFYFTKRQSNGLLTIYDGQLFGKAQSKRLSDSLKSKMADYECVNTHIIFTRIMPPLLKKQQSFWYNMLLKIFDVFACREIFKVVDSFRGV